VTKFKRTPKLDNLHEKILVCIEQKRYTQSKHAIQRQTERNVELTDVLYVLKNGYCEKRKTSFDEVFETWKYAIRGKTLEGLDIRVIIAFDKEEMFIITVMRVK